MDLPKSEWGFSPEVTNHEYHHGAKRVFASSGGVNALLKSPAHFFHNFIENNEERTSPAMRLGKLVHERILEPDKFKENVVVKPAFGNERLKDVRIQRDAWIEAQGSKEVVTADEVVLIEEMESSVSTHPIAKPYFIGGKAELTGYFMHPVVNVPCRIRVDYLADDNTIIDLKTTRDAGFEAFMKSVRMYNYHVQAAFYYDGIHAITGIKPRKYMIVAVEKEAPYPVAVYEMDRYSLEYGRSLYIPALQAYKECVENDWWPGYPEHVKKLVVSPPRYKKEQPNGSNATTREADSGDDEPGGECEEYSQQAERTI